MKQDVLPIGGNIMTYIASAIQTNELLQSISFAVSILTSIVIIAYKFWIWHKEASKDGKITKDEIDKLADSLSDDVKDLHDKTKGGK